MNLKKNQCHEDICQQSCSECCEGITQLPDAANSLQSWLIHALAATLHAAANAEQVLARGEVKWTCWIE